MRIHEEGFRIAMQKELQLNRDQAENFYNDHRGQPYFDELISRMTMYANCVLTMYANLMLMFYVPPLNVGVVHRFWSTVARDRGIQEAPLPRRAQRIRRA